MKHAIGPRREIGIRTVFNILGPLTNPAGATRQVIGVYAPELTESLCQVLQTLGSTRAYVVHGEDGLDEITLTGKTRISELYRGRVQTFDFDPRDLGFSLCDGADLKGGDVETNGKITMAILGGEKGPRRDIVLLNAAAALVVAGRTDSPEEGAELARQSIDSGRAMEKLEALRKITRAPTV